MTEQASVPRRRRQPGEVDTLIIDAAREMFAAKGYAGTSSREIAALAGVHEPAIYRRFGSKAGLFDAAVLAPFNEAISEYLARWESQLEQPASTEQLVRNWIEPTYTMLIEHRELLMALLSAQQYNDGDLAEDRPWVLDSLLKRMDGQATLETDRRELGSGGDPGLTVRVSAAMVLGMVLLGDWILGIGPNRRSDREIIEEMVRMTTYGVEHRDGSGPAPVPVPLTTEPLKASQLSVILDRLADAERRAALAESELARLKSS